MIVVEGEPKKSLKCIRYINNSIEMVGMILLVRGNKIEPLVIKGAPVKVKIKGGRSKTIQIKGATLIKIVVVKQIKVESLEKVP